jgi:hypothetical protein
MAGGNAGGAAARVLLFVLGLVLVAGDDPYRFFTWTVTYGDIYPLGVKQQVRSWFSHSPSSSVDSRTAKNELAEAVVDGIGLFVCRGS